MPSSYDETLPTNKDKARSLLGDVAVTPGTTTIPDDAALHSDQHIATVLALLTPFESAVAWLADELVTRFAQEPVKVTLTGLAVDYTPRIPAWQALAARMRATVDQAAADAAAAASKVATGATLRKHPRPDYTLAGGDVVEEA